MTLPLTKIPNCCQNTQSVLENKRPGEILMRIIKSLLVVLSLTVLAAVPSQVSTAQQSNGTSSTPIKTVELNPATSEISVGQKVKFNALAKDASGREVKSNATAWFAAPFDLAAVDESGNVSFFAPGEVLVGAIVGGKTIFTTVKVKAGPVTRVEIEPVKTPLFVGATTKLAAIARSSEGNPRNDAAMSWSSSNPQVASVDAAGVVIGLSPGEAKISAMSGSGLASLNLSVIESNLSGLSIEPRTTNARTGDVVRFNVRAKSGTADNTAVRWTVSGPAATINNDGGFVAELPGSYVITAASGPQEAIASVVVTPRNVERSLEVIGRAQIKDVPTAEEWIIGNYAYVSTISDKFLVFDISNPAEPKLTDSSKWMHASSTISAPRLTARYSSSHEKAPPAARMASRFMTLPIRRIQNQFLNTPLPSPVESTARLLMATTFI